MEQNFPRIIQGGMGLGVSNWRLAREVSRTGQLGVVSLVAAPQIVCRTLQDGDPGGHFRRAFEQFPLPRIADEVMKQYYLPQGRKGKPYVKMPTASLFPTHKLEELAVITAWAQVWLAKEGHDGKVGVNLLEKIQMTHPATVFAAMLAGVDVLLVGAGIPDQFPGMITGLMNWEEIAYRVQVKEAAAGEEHRLPFDPNVSFGQIRRNLRRPAFFAIVSSSLLASFLMDSDKDSQVNGFVVEAPSAGGHNAPPRGRPKFNERGEPVYGPRDEVDFAKMRALGLPFWCAGSYARPEAVKRALEVGAAGIQTGSIFALCEESGFRQDLKVEARRRAFNGELDVYTDPNGSPSGFPFKTALIQDTVANPEVYRERRRVCNVGGFKEPAKLPDGRIVYRCSAEPVETFVKLGGKREETENRKCLCNSLLSAVGLAQSYRNGYVEPALMTMGDDTSFVRRLMKHEDDTWTAKEAVDYLLELMG
jgi:NAD(P)H-dependent flavin oxidoreductase YrpB (nitropropane dioxygenase family)